MNTLKKKSVLVGIGVLSLVFGSLVYSHCQVPCGIYGDQTRFATLEEHVVTIEKAVKQINELSAETKPNHNQIVRWVNTKEEHADDIAHIVTQYFLAQRVKFPARDDVKAHHEYVNKLTSLHEILVYAMKTKQATDLENVARLKASLAKFHAVYTGKAEHGEGHDHSHSGEHDHGH